MRSPLNKHSEIDCSETSKLMSNITNSYISSMSLSIDSTTSLSNSSSVHRISQSVDVNQQIPDDDDHHSNAIIPVTNSHQPKTYSIETIGIENDGSILFQR